MDLTYLARDGLQLLVQAELDNRTQSRKLTAREERQAPLQRNVGRPQL